MSHTIQFPQSNLAFSPDEPVRGLIKHKLPSPFQLKAKFPISNKAFNTVENTRAELSKIHSGQSSKFLIILGPCSIHDPSSAFEYALKLQKLSQKVSDKILIVMRTYLEKPRTKIGWKGFVNDPDLDQSFNMSKGLSQSRELLIAINELGVPCAIEFLDILAAKYFTDLISWGAIGARTSESQPHREMASSLPIMVGFKNNTDGNLEVALNGMQVAKTPQAIIAIDPNGQLCQYQTSGNPYTNLILRGGKDLTNFHLADLLTASSQLEEGRRSLLVDCSHGNCQGDFTKQTAVFQSVLKARPKVPKLLGAMLESHIVEGKQSISNEMNYGQSITDPCLGWETTEQLVLDAYTQLGSC